jgi:hypothetical protein
MHPKRVPADDPVQKKRVTLVAVAPDGTEVKIRTAADYTWAGIAKRTDGTWVLLAKGWSYKPVADRTGRAWRKERHLGFQTGWTVVKFRRQQPSAPTAVKAGPPAVPQRTQLGVMR